MRLIPERLQKHMNQDATTLCNLIKITNKEGKSIGLTTLDINVVYDDGSGPLTYYAPVGFQPSSIYQEYGFEVGNAEFQALVVPEYDLDLDEFSVNAGIWDYADFYMYQVNYEDLSMGHWVVMRGTMGQMRSQDGLQIFGEMRSLTDSFRRNVNQLDSLSCRAIFGSKEDDERFPCGYDTESLWLDGVVTSVGVENTRTFTDTSREEEEGFFEPGIIQFLTGKNAGKYMEIETYTPDEINLAFYLTYPIEVGDEYRIRRDCSKIARDEEKGCKHWYGDEWVKHFRGEPDIPVGDAGSIMTPGAQI